MLAMRGDDLPSIGRMQAQLSDRLRLDQHKSCPRKKMRDAMFEEPVGEAGVRMNESRRMSPSAVRCKFG